MFQAYVSCLTHAAYRNFVQKFSDAASSLKRNVPVLAPRAPQDLGKLLELMTVLPPIISSLPDILSQGSTAPIKANVPKTSQPEVENLGPSEIGWGMRRVRVRYGPFRLPAKTEKNLDWLVWNMEGAVTNLKYNVKRPCEGECWIGRIVSDLEFAEGKSATVEDGVSHSLRRTLADVLGFIPSYHSLQLWPQRQRSDLQPAIRGKHIHVRKRAYHGQLLRPRRQHPYCISRRP
jgi:hypothetical protein